MKYLITFVRVSKRTRKRTAKAQTVIFETDLTNPVRVEQEFEAKHNRPLEHDECTVVDVRPAERTCQHCGGTHSAQMSCECFDNGSQ